MKTEDLWYYLASCWEASEAANWWDFARGHQDLVMGGIDDAEQRKTVLEVLTYFEDVAILYNLAELPCGEDPAVYRESVRGIFCDWYETVFLPYKPETYQASETVGPTTGSAEHYGPAVVDIPVSRSQTEPDSQSAKKAVPGGLQPVSAATAAYASGVFQTFGTEGGALPANHVEILQHGAVNSAVEEEYDRPIFEGL
ncbi:hypothetical protein AB0D66_33555 [Streptomyces sp. NPDC048270]|uniref:hypothetical protein n=1 Tax=Streptomyces sp. NPDC048270 TaxID=3154615 RepID=UPI0033E5AC86